MNKEFEEGVILPGPKRYITLGNTDYLIENSTEIRYKILQDCIILEAKRETFTIFEIK